jgi:hypothetical protein
VRRAAINENVLDIAGRHLVFKDLEVSGGSTGLRLLGGSGFITMEGCAIHDNAGNGIRATDNFMPLYEGLRLVGNQVYRTGATAINLGCSNAMCQVANALVEGNYIHDISGASGSGIQVHSTSYGNTVRDNVIHDTTFPCIATYGAGTMTNLPNVVERNALWRCGEHGVQATRDVVIRNNLVLGAVVDGINVQPHATVSGGPQDVRIVHNTIIDPDGDGIFVQSAVGPVVIVDNAVYASTGRAVAVNGSTATVTNSNNVAIGFDGDGGELARDLSGANYSGAVPNDLFPRSGSPLVGAGSDTTGTSEDFNGSPRAPPHTIGAYQFRAAGNPGWILSPSMKPRVQPDGGEPDGGNPDDAGRPDGGTASTNRRELGVGCGCLESAGSGLGVTLLLMGWRRRLRR